MKEHLVKCLQKEENKRANTRANIYTQPSFNCGILDIFYDLNEVIEKEMDIGNFQFFLFGFVKSVCTYTYCCIHEF